MKPHRKKRFYWILFILAGVSVAVGLAMYALDQNINLYVTPSQLLDTKIPKEHVFRMGGMVKKGSFQRVPQTLTVHFVLTDYQHEVPVEYTGVLPALFKEGQGIVVQGKMGIHSLIATEVLAKHDENYMPPKLISH